MGIEPQAFDYEFSSFGLNIFYWSIPKGLGVAKLRPIHFTIASIDKSLRRGHGEGCT